jgi:hypothetical protein
MSEEETGWGGSFDETRLRQDILGLELSPLERLAWLEARRAEVARLRERMESTGRAVEPVGRRRK